MTYHEIKPTATVDGVTKRENLRVVKINSSQRYAVVNSLELSTLCFEDTIIDELKVFTPVCWGTEVYAENWIKNGSVDGLMGSNVGFQTIQAQRVEKKKEFVVVEKWLEEHRNQKNKIFVWLEKYAKRVHLMAYDCDLGIKTIAAISEKGIYLSLNAEGVGIAVDPHKGNKMKVIS